jgi:hypothetical protein
VKFALTTHFASVALAAALLAPALSAIAVDWALRRTRPRADRAPGEGS